MNSQKKLLQILAEKIIKLKNKFNNYNFLVISSRRTNQEDNRFIRKHILDGIANVWNKKTKNPYLFALKKFKIFYCNFRFYFYDF